MKGISKTVSTHAHTSTIHDIHGTHTHATHIHDNITHTHTCGIHIHTAYTHSVHTHMTYHRDLKIKMSLKKRPPHQDPLRKIYGSVVSLSRTEEIEELAGSYRASA